MRKKLIAALLALIICIVPLAGCGNTVTSYPNVEVTGTQSTDYVVRGNGGNAVQYGNYVYFINGTRGYDDTDGKSNQWGNVIKGALFRAELNGEKQDREFAISRDNVTNLEFASSKGLDYDEKAVDVIDTQLIAPITVGTSGYKDGGIFIFDNYVYYASPNSEKDKVGAVQSNKTDFFFSRLDGKDTKRIYTTDSDSADKPYGFYRWNGGVYLVVLDGANLVSVRVKNGSVEDKLKIAENVTSAYFPVKTEYDSKNYSSNDPEDFVYFTRAVKDGDVMRTGNVTEVMRPNGKERVKILETGYECTIEGVRDGLFFYRGKNSLDDTYVKYTNLHETFYEFSPAYKAEQDKLAENERKGAEAGTALTSLPSGVTSSYAFRPNKNSATVYIAYSDSSGIYLYENNSRPKRIYEGSSTISFVDGNYVYFTESDGTLLYRTNLYTAASDKSEEEKKEQMTSADMTATGLKPEVCAGYLVYFGVWDEWASGYPLFSKLNGLAGEEPVKIGLRIKADVKSDSTT